MFKSYLFINIRSGRERILIHDTNFDIYINPLKVNFAEELISTTDHYIFNQIGNLPINLALIFQFYMKDNYISDTEYNRNYYKNKQDEVIYDCLSGGEAEKLIQARNNYLDKLNLLK